MNDVETPATQCFRYHPTLAPKGRRFYTDELPQEEGWVESPTQFPGWKGDKPSPEPTQTLREPPVEVFRYHKEHGAVRFWTNALPSEDDGWFDTPTAAAKWEPGKAPDDEPNPKAFACLDDFMDAYVARHITEDTPKKAQGQARKRGIEDYARVKFGLDLDLRKPIEVLAEEVRAKE